MLGTNISYYKVLEKIGEGGMGEVYLAQDSYLDTSNSYSQFEDLPGGRR